MARRGWGASIATALGVAAGAGAAQLGFGYGLGIINWTPPGGAPGEAAWAASLAWATWISATSVVAGAVCAHRLRGDDDEPGPTLRHLTLAVAAGVGAVITVLLVAVPARAARVPDTFSPQTVAAGYAAVGLLIGLLLAIWALHSRAAAGNLVATSGWLWLLAVVSVVDGVLSGRGLGTAQLGIWQISADSERYWIRDYFYWPGALLAMGSAVVIGALAARGAARTPERRVGAAASGAAGPILVALGYLLAVPRLAAISPEQMSAHLVAPYAVIAGIGGSVLVAALAQRAERRAAERVDVPLPRQGTAEPDDPSGRPAGQPAAGAPEAGDTGPVAAKPAAGWRLFGRRSGGTGSAEAATAPVPLNDADAEPPAQGEKLTAAEPSSGVAPRARATGGRSRAVPPQRKPSDQPAFSDETGDASDAAPTGAGTGPGSDATGPGTGPKARRRGR
ncbi:hypothetical protein Q2K19_10935 [Micromonospora soli]|uniref:hypothetical protein n=1 Tax=Micromonospora sp. NBRC 110009 TaxID=3061627 RepID=UPI002672845D|nr:hypothetical protein [Micromonospora sp. NBRC 110009]WKU00951.1 hypothetical protein Q2K19_10935 [Micromonospora sp. NBRC 110009]